jgi:hypothetical protein
MDYFIEIKLRLWRSDGILKYTFVEIIVKMTSAGPLSRKNILKT